MPRLNLKSPNFSARPEPIASKTVLPNTAGEQSNGSSDPPQLASDPQTAPKRAWWHWPWFTGSSETNSPNSDASMLDEIVKDLP